MKFKCSLNFVLFLSIACVCNILGFFRNSGKNVKIVLCYIKSIIYPSYFIINRELNLLVIVVIKLKKPNIIRLEAMLNYQIYHNTCKTLNNFGLDDFYIHFVRVIHCLTVYVLCSINQTVFLNSSFQSHACRL